MTGNILLRLLRTTIVTPDTIPRRRRKPPHCPTQDEPEPPSTPSLIVRMATENANWGDLRIGGELKKVAHTVARITIARTRMDNGIALSLDRPTS